MKLSIKTFVVLFAAATMYACNSSEPADATAKSDSAGSDKPAMMDTAHVTDTSHSELTSASSPEQEFLNYAIPANAKELLWLQAAETKSTSKEIKQHAAMMTKDHKKLGAAVKEFMSKKTGYTMPGVDTANVVNINDKTGADWDKAWTDKMVEAHQELLDRLKMAKGDVKDADLQKIVTGAIPVVESHLAMVKGVKTKLP